MKKTLLIMVMVTMLALTGCGQEEAKKPAIPTPPTAVKVLDLSQDPNFNITEIGTIKPIKEVDLVAKTAGNIDQLSIKLGDVVREGQVIASLNLEDVNNPAKVNYQTAELQLSNARQTLDETRANNQDAVAKAQLRVDTLTGSIQKLERNLQDLKTQNQNTQTSLELQIQTAETSLQIAQDNEQTLVDKFAQSQKDLLNSTKTSLDSVLVDLESNFAAVETILNPSKALYFNVQDLNKGIGASNSAKRSEMVNLYLSYRNDFPTVKTAYQDSLPALQEGLVGAEESIELMRESTRDMKDFLAATRTTLNLSVVSNTLSQAQLDGYLNLIAAAEAKMLADLSKLDGLNQSIASFKLDQISQLANAQNNKIIAQNQLAEAQNGLIKFKTDSQAAVNDLEDQIQLSQNDLLSAQADLDSTKRSNVIQDSSKQLEINTLNNQLKIAQNTLEDNKVTSTIAGVVSALNVEEGDYVSPGTPLAKIIDKDQVKIVFYLSKENAERLFVGQEFTFTLDQNGQSMSGFVTRISPTADAQNKKILVEGQASNPQGLLKPEMYVNVQVDASQQTFDPSKIYVPMNAIIFAQNTQYVYVAENGMALRKQIEIGDIFGLWVEVTAGLEKSELLIIEGQRNLPPSGDTRVTISS